MKKILYIQFTTVPSWPVLMHGANILASKGWKVLLLGAENVSNPSNRVEVNAHKNIIMKSLGFVKPGFMQKVQYFFYNIWVFVHLIFWRPQVVFASEKLVCPIAYIIKLQNKKIKLIYFEPMYAGEGVQIKPRFVREYRKKLAKIADLCLVPSEARLEKFIEEVGNNGNAIFVCNFPRYQEFEDIPVKEKPTTGRLKLFSCGHIGPYYLPIQLFEALEELKEKVELVIVGMDAPLGEKYSTIVVDEIKKRGLQENVNYVGLIKKRSDLLKECSKADVGLSFNGKTTIKGYPPPEFRNETGSQRPFEYMGLGLVVLVSDLQEWEDFFVKDGYAYSCDSENSESIKQTLEYLYDNRDSLFEKGKRNRGKILTEWNYNIEFKKVEKYIENPHDAI